MGEIFLRKLSCVIQGEPPVFPVKQRDAQFRLQPLDGLGQSRLGNVKILHSVGDMFVPGGNHKIAKPDPAAGGHGGAIG